MYGKEARQFLQSATTLQPMVEDLGSTIESMIALLSNRTRDSSILSRLVLVVQGST